jgi:hypothetical protein
MILNISHSLFAAYTMSCNRDVTQKVGCMFKRAHANVEHQPPALLKVNSSSVHHTFLVYRRLRHEGHTPQPPMATMDLCASNDTSLWSRCWRAKGLSGHGGYSNTGTCPHYPSHELFFLTRREDLLTEPKPFCRAGSTLSAKPITSTLPTTISGDAAVAEVAALLRAHREEIKASSKSARKRRELAIARNVGIQAFKWLKQLDGLDERHVITKECCNDLGWLLVAEGNEQPMISWFMEEGTGMLRRFAPPTRVSYRDPGSSGNRTRRRHDLIAALVGRHPELSLDGTANHAVRCLGVVVSDAIRLGIEGTFGLAGPLTVLHRAIKNDTSPPMSAALFDEYLSMIPKASPKLAGEYIADAMLYHPVAPNPSVIFHRMEEDMAQHLRARNGIPRMRWDRMGFNYIRAMFILQREGAALEANTVIQVLQEHFPRVWHKRHGAVNKLKKDPKLRHIPTRPGNAIDEIRPQDATHGPQSAKLPEDDAAVREIEDVLAAAGPEIEEPGRFEASSELLELRSRKKR